MLSGKRRQQLRNLSLAPYQLYPEASQLSASFLGEPRGTYRITRTTPICSMGSCFAREIKKYLILQRYRYVQTENNRWSSHASCSWERVYTAANALEIANYTVSQELPPARIYPHGSRYVDLLRNKVAYESREEAENDIRVHLRASKAALETCELCIFTVGQNEVWRSRSGGFFFANRPPQSWIDSQDAELAQLSVEENLLCLRKFRELLRQINPNLRLLLTLSPVPSLATFYDANVVLRSVLNKSILRLALERFVQECGDDVIYFPSYEIVQSWRGDPFLADNRHVKPKVVSAIMKAFFFAYAAER